MQSWTKANRRKPPGISSATLDTSKRMYNESRSSRQFSHDRYHDHLLLLYMLRLGLAVAASAATTAKPEMSLLLYAQNLLTTRPAHLERPGF